MKYFAKVKKLDEHLEEEVTLDIDGVVFTAFIDICPYEIKEGQDYPVNISFTIFNDLHIRLIENRVKELERIQESYRYLIRGIVREGLVDAGLRVVDEEGYLDDYPEIIGEYAEIKVDRIGVEFL
ncbi:hypothetical protein [Priestia flexa]|uniref:hypothetical protein n=1 Tax=Priestia flexa TaxID=86664 RepID=UPI000955EB8F|nr:hypothetical protein [Priestia flexa]SIR56143.1 hypothetical protein SAMN05880580_13820 [Priestia flexa]